jgi:sulfotransferase
MIQFVWNSSLPRSGSTLLQNLAAQCQTNHVTATSGLAELIVAVRNRWVDIKEFQSQGINECAASMAAAMRGLLTGYYATQITAGKTVWDKSRGWVGYARLLDEMFGERQKIVVCVRDVREIVTSFEMLWRHNQITRKDGTGPALFEGVTIEGRVHHLLALDAVVGQSIAMLRDCLHSDPDRLLIVPYKTLCSNPQGLMSQLHRDLALPEIVIQSDEVKQSTVENDSAWGFQDMHAIRSTVSAKQDRWPEILPPRLAAWIEDEYRDINQLAAGVC